MSPVRLPPSDRDRIIRETIRSLLAEGERLSERRIRDRIIEDRGHGVSFESIRPHLREIRERRQRSRRVATAIRVVREMDREERRVFVDLAQADGLIPTYRGWSEPEDQA